jgi:hypothetical protein
MTRPGLFAEMDAAVDALRIPYGPELVVGDLQFEFRQIQKARMPELAEAEWLDLFHIWLAGYVARVKRRREQAFAGILEFAEQSARERPPAPPFRCVCGAETRDPLDPAWMAIHQPHCVMRRGD